MKTETQYRELQPGELVQDGDELQLSSGHCWTVLKGGPALNTEQQSGMRYRRPVAPAAQPEHCADCDPSFLECWNNRTKCRKYVQPTGAGWFGHHPDPATDFCVEVEAIEGWEFDLRAGARNEEALERSKPALFAKLKEIFEKRAEAWKPGQPTGEKALASALAEIQELREELENYKTNAGVMSRGFTKLETALVESERLHALTKAERDKLSDDFKMYRGLFTRIKDQIIAGNGPEEMLRWQDALKENDKGDGRVDAVAALITYFYKLCSAKDKVAAERDRLTAENATLSFSLKRLLRVADYLPRFAEELPSIQWREYLDASFEARAALSEGDAK